jgi:chlorobactene glucosyltransferase
MASILVPARDEALNIEGCLHTLLNQDYEPYEVIVLDDESQDATPEILAYIHHDNPRLKTLTGQPLPCGWMGKNWACHQLSQAAQGELILFLDADTRHRPSMLTDAVSALLATGADLLSGLPRQEMKTWGERLILPVLPWAILSFFPVRLFQRLPFSFLSISVGQFMLFRRGAYLQIGGHWAVRSSVIEDFALARLVKANGLKWEFVDLNGRANCRMYQDIRQVLDGLSKNLFAVFGHNLAVFLFIWFWLAIVFIQPLLTLISYALGAPLPGTSPALALPAVGLSLFSWLISLRFYKMPLAQAAAYPLTIALTGLIAVRSAWIHDTQRSISWKGRPLKASRHQVDT